MAWNPQKKPNQGLPDLEAHLKKFFKNLFAARKPSDHNQAPSSQHPGKTWATILLVLLSMWGVSGIYQVQPGQQAISTSFGRMQILNPGWHWYARFIEHKYIVDTDRVMSVSLNESLISQDQAVLSLAFNMGYQVKNAQQYFFNTANFSIALQQIIEAKLTEDVAKVSLAQLLQDPSKLNQTLRQQIQALCDQYNMGISIDSVTVKNITVPGAVAGVLSSMQNAAQSGQSLQDQATQQADAAMQAAKNQAAKIIKEAQDQAAQAVPRAQRETAEFLAILPAYQQNPQLTRERMYYDTMEKVYANARVIVVGSNATINLPANLWQNDTAVVTQADNAQAAVSASRPSKQKSLGAYLRWKEAQESES